VPRPTRRFGGLVLGAALLFVIGTNIQSGWLLVLASLLLGAAAAGTALPLRDVCGVVVERRAPARVEQGDQVAVDLDVAARGRSRISLVVEDPYLSSVRVLAPPLGSGGRVRLRTTRMARRRGRQPAAAVTIASSAPFGVATARRSVVPAGGVPGETLVVPTVVEVPAVAATGSVHASEASTTAPPRPGWGSDYLGVREYRPGDSMRHVHWPSTARTGSLMVREMEAEQPPSLLLVVDTIADSTPGPEAGRTPLDTACCIAASLCVASIEAGRRVVLAAARAGDVDVIEPATAEHALDWLAELRAGGGMPVAATLARLGERLVDPASAVVACASWRANVDGLASAMGRLPAPARSTIAIVDVEAFGGRPSARALAGPEVEALERALEAGGVNAVRVRGREDLVDVLRRIGAGATA
jgi:uncharacterized protein (DUF58 family)